MRTKFVLVVSLTTLVLLIVLVMAIDTQSTGWRVTSTEKTVDVYSNCKKVITTSGPDVFAPTNTEAEWNAFIANKPASVTLSDCVFLLINGVHTDADCTSAGGVVYDTGAGYICRFGGLTCVVGWTQYNSWTTTTANTCDSPDVGCSSCTTSFHSWADTAQETCSYQLRPLSVCLFLGICQSTLTEVGCY